MSIGSFFRNIFSHKNVVAAEHVVITEVQEVAAYIAPAVASDLKAVIATLNDKTMPSIEKLEALSVEAVKAVADALHLNISKDLAIVVAQKVYTDAKAAAVAEAQKLLTQIGG